MRHYIDFVGDIVQVRIEGKGRAVRATIDTGDGRFLIGRIAGRGANRGIDRFVVLAIGTDVDGVYATVPGTMITTNRDRAIGAALGMIDAEYQDAKRERQAAERAERDAARVRAMDADRAAARARMVASPYDSAGLDRVDVGTRVVWESRNLSGESVARSGVVVGTDEFEAQIETADADGWRIPLSRLILARCPVCLRNPDLYVPGPVSGKCQVCVSMDREQESADAAWIWTRSGGPNAVAADAPAGDDQDPVCPSCGCGPCECVDPEPYDGPADPYADVAETDDDFVPGGFDRASAPAPRPLNFDAYLDSFLICWHIPADLAAGLLGIPL